MEEITSIHWALGIIMGLLIVILWKMPKKE